MSVEATTAVRLGHFVITEDKPYIISVRIETSDSTSPNDLNLQI